MRLPCGDCQGYRINMGAPVSLALQRGRAGLQVRPGPAADTETGHQGTRSERDHDARVKHDAVAGRVVVRA